MRALLLFWLPSSVTWLQNSKRTHWVFGDISMTKYIQFACLSIHFSSSMYFTTTLYGERFAWRVCNACQICECGRAQSVMWLFFFVLSIEQSAWKLPRRRLCSLVWLIVSPTPFHEFFFYLTFICLNGQYFGKFMCDCVRLENYSVHLAHFNFASF